MVGTLKYTQLIAYFLSGTLDSDEKSGNHLCGSLSAVQQALEICAGCHLLGWARRCAMLCFFRVVIIKNLINH